MSTISVPVSKLTHSPRNVRAPSDTDDTGDLEGTILELGLINPPTAHPMPRGRYGVVAGGRRLLALQRLIARGDLPKTHQIDIIVRDEDDATLTELSFAENEVRVALPAVTEFRTYQRLVTEGADVAAIARRYQVPELHVRQRMRLGQLHPDILDALAVGQISLDLAKAYAATADQDLQKRIFDQQPGHVHEIRAALRRDAVAAGVDRMIGLVGMDAYAAAGGRAEQDLFTAGESRILDVDLLRRLYDEKLAAERLRLGIPDSAAVQFEFAGVGPRVEVTPELDDKEWERACDIDNRVGEIDGRLEDIASFDDDGPIGRFVADPGADQDEVDRLAAEKKRLEEESEALHGSTAAGIEGALIAVVEIVPGRLLLRGYYRPHGWIDPSPAAARPAAGKPPIVPVEQLGKVTANATPAAEAKPVINGFRQDRGQFTGGHIYRQPEEVAKEEYGLTKDAVEAMRSHRRQILQSALLQTPIAEMLAHKFLIFVLARDMLRQRGADDYLRDTSHAGDLGVDRLPSREHDPHHVRADLATQPGGRTVANALDRLRAQPWMTEADPATAFRKFSMVPHADLQRAASCVATAMLSRSLNVPGFGVPVHQVLAEFLNIDCRTRDHWEPDAAFFARLPKNRKLEAIAFADPAAAKRLSTLGTEDLTTAAAWIMSGDASAGEKYGLSREALARARGWVPPYLLFDDAEATDDPDGDDPDGADALAVEAA